MGTRSKSRSALSRLTWLLQDEIDADERRALQVLEHALLGTPGSPLRKALIDSGLGEDLTSSGLETELAQLFFSVGLKGVQQGDVDAVETLILQYLGELAEGGVDQGMVAASLHTAEFRLRENNTGSFPRGLGLMLRLLTDWLYDRDPFTPLRFADSFTALKAKLAADDRYLEGLIQRHLLDNEHRTTVVLQPDAELGTRMEAEETTRLAEARASMSHAELEDLVAATQKLKHLQEQPDAPEDLAKLPRLQLSDLDAAIKTMPRQEDQIAGVPVLHHDLFTNGIAYLDVGCNLRVLPQELLPYIPLFGRALLEMGHQTHELRRTATADRQPNRRPECPFAGGGAPRRWTGRNVSLFARQGHGRTGRRSDGDCARRAARGPPRRSRALLADGLRRAGQRGGRAGAGRAPSGIHAAARAI